MLDGFFYEFMGLACICSVWRCSVMSSGEGLVGMISYSLEELMTTITRLGVDCILVLKAGSW